MDPLLLVLRLLIPLTIFKFPLFGALASALLDGLDWNTNLMADPDIHKNYSYYDRLLDFYYLGIEFYVLRKWKNVLVKRTAQILFVIRSLGIGLYLYGGPENFLVFFPNIFEVFFLFYLTTSLILRGEPKMSWGWVLITLLFLGIPKLVQEYFMHTATLTGWRYVSVSVFTYDNIYHQVLIGALWILLTVFKYRKAKFSKLRI